jgi:serine phosphatase RsbU (regulator of sigma subunit)
VRCLIGDVRGKGLDAIESVTVVLGTFREGERRAGLDGMEGFSTAVLAEFPPAGDVVRLLNRGHPGPLLLGPHGSVHCAEPSRSALPLGLGELSATPGTDPVDTFPFPPGSALLLHTDGVTEARDTAGAFYDPVAGLTGRRFAGPGPLLDALLAEVHRHTGSRGSDVMALLAVSRPGHPSRPSHPADPRRGEKPVIHP